jgi:hypothetical protein
MNMRKIGYWLSIITVFALSQQASAMSLKPKSSYKTLAPGGKYVFVMISPKTIDKDAESVGEDRAAEIREIRASYSVSGFYPNDGSRTPLWTVDWYAYEVYPASDGVHLVRPGLSRLWSPPGWNDIAVEFYASGKLLRSYKVRELVDVPRLLISDSFVPKWRAEHNFEDTTLRYTLRTIHGEQFVFDARTGEMLEGSRLVAWARSGGLFAALGALVLISLVWDWKHRRKKNQNLVRSKDSKDGG